MDRILGHNELNNTRLTAKSNVVITQREHPFSEEQI